MLTLPLTAGIIAALNFPVIPFTPHPISRTLSLFVLPAACASTDAARTDLHSNVGIHDSQTREIISQPTLRRQIAPIRFTGDRRAYEFLVTHPPLATQLARRLHPPLERYTVTQVEEGVYTVEDRGALKGEARLIAATDGRRIYRLQGEFRSLANLLRFRGRMVLILRYREVRDGGRTAIESDPDFYLRIDHPFFHVMSKLLSPLIHAILDRRIHMIVEATGTLFDRVQTDPNGLYQQMRTWPEVRHADLEAYRLTLIEKESVTQ